MKKLSNFNQTVMSELPEIRNTKEEHSYNFRAVGSNKSATDSIKKEQIITFQNYCWHEYGIDFKVFVNKAGR
jgi:hypothetical protein